ncbi:hypothetical protein T484DRAFT_1741827 [Baffinella frigidus]|nr:hypothetical protein T484DRAFT_1741827 [Cryptophyta sp. CCMP2293]
MLPPRIWHPWGMLVHGGGRLQRRLWARRSVARWRWPEKDVVEITGPLPASFTLSTDCSLKPQDNTQLSGLYKSSGMYCTQCEVRPFTTSFSGHLDPKLQIRTVRGAPLRKDTNGH